MPKLQAIALFGAFFLAGCQDSGRVAELESKVRSLETAHKELEDKLFNLAMNVAAKSVDSEATLKPGDTGYSVVTFDLGHLTVTMEDVKAYANGSRVALLFGNTTSARLNGLKGTIAWGKADERGRPILDSVKSKEFTFANPINAGSWARFEVVLEATPPQDLGFVRIKEMGHQGVSLRN